MWEVQLALANSEACETLLIEPHANHANVDPSQLPANFDKILVPQVIKALYVIMQGLCLDGYCSFPLLSCSIATGALESPSLLPSYSIITIALHIIIILIIIHLSTSTHLPSTMHVYIYRYWTRSETAREEIESLFAVPRHMRIILKHLRSTVSPGNDNYIGRDTLRSLKMYVLILRCIYSKISLCLCVCMPWLSIIASSKGSYRVVHWRANTGLLLSYSTIYNIPSIILIY